jgi:hypothetical protein
MKSAAQCVFYCMFLLMFLLTGCNKEVAAPPETKEIEYKIVENKDNLIKIRAKPEAGFNYDYYLYVPNGAKESDVKYMLVEPNNSGNADDNSQFHDEQASNLIKYWICNKIANSLRIPLLVPTFDRPRSEWKMYTHALDRDTLMNKSGKLARVDLQLIKMIENAQQILNENGIKVDDKVFMDGFSASGNFVNRFAALHPEKVRAVASGGVNGMPIIPYEYMNGEKLIYHVGVADIEEITGIKFNMKEYREVAQYIYMGEWDTNDTLKFSDAYSEEEVRITEKVLGKEMKDRWLKAQEILKKAEIPAQMVTYNGTTHQVKPEMVSDIIAFFRANASSDIKFIEPFQYPFVEFKTLEQVHIKAAYWNGDPNIESWIKGLKINNFIVLTDDWISGRDYTQLSEFIHAQPEGNLKILLKHQGKTNVKAAITGASFSFGDGSYQGFIAEVTESELTKMKRGVPYSLYLENENNSLFINKGVTVTMP